MAEVREIVGDAVVSPVRVLAGDSQDVIDMAFGIIFGILFVVYAFLISYCGIKLGRIRQKYES